jgi:hypothetical protein
MALNLEFLSKSNSHSMLGLIVLVLYAFASVKKRKTLKNSYKFKMVPNSRWFAKIDFATAKGEMT